MTLESRYLQTFKHAVVFGLGVASSKVIEFLLLPLYTSRLSTSEYGVLSILNTTIAILGPLLQMGLSTSTFKYYFSINDPDRRKTAVSTAFFWLAGVGLLSAIVFSLGGGTWSQVLLGSRAYVLHLQLVFFALSFMTIKVVPFALFRVQKKSLQYSILSVLEFLVAIVLNIYFVAVVKMGVLGVLVANLIALIASSMVGVFLCRHEIKISFSWTLMGRLLRYGLPLVPSALGAFVLAQSDRYFLRYFSGLSQIGTYSLGCKFGGVISMFIVQPFQLIWLPMAFEMENRPRAKRFYESMLTYFLVIATWVALALSLFSKEVIALVTAPDFHESYVIVPWIAFAFVFYGAYMVVNIGIYLQNKTRWIIGIVGSSALVNLFLNFLLVSRIYVLGAALATFLSYLFLLFVAWRVNHRIYPLAYQWKRIFKLSVVIVLLLAAGLSVRGSFLLSVMTKLVILIAFWPGLLVMRFFNERERQAVQNFLSGRCPSIMRGVKLCLRRITRPSAKQ